MPIAVIMPKFEMAQETGTVAAWAKAEGDIVRKGDVLLEVETDKVNMEVESPADGILMGISAENGEVVPIGQTIAYICQAGESLPDDTAPSQTQDAAGDTSPIPCRPAGGASPLAVRLAEDLAVDLALVAGTGLRGKVTKEDVESFAATRRTAVQRPTAESDDGAVRAVPAARREARALGVDLHRVSGKGPEGRIQSEDVREYAAAEARRLAGAGDLGLGARPGAVAEQPLGIGPGIRRLAPLTNIRRTIAERMTASVREAPQFTVSVDAEMTRALAIIEDLRGDRTSGDQPRVTLTALLIKACAWALHQHPGANASYQEGQIAEWDEVNIGVATAIESGLIVPVIRQADRLGMRSIAARLADLTTRARENRLKIDDLQGGTFTLSNLGMFGIDRFTAILNPPQAAILAVGRVAKQPVVLADDRVDVRSMTTLTLTADHRVLDGVTAAKFLATIQQVLEHPGMLLE